MVNNDNDQRNVQLLAATTSRSTVASEIKTSSNADGVLFVSTGFFAFLCHFPDAHGVEIT
jgi:hypothetical protein